jgi:hypothetical protein
LAPHLGRCRYQPTAHKRTFALPIRDERVLRRALAHELSNRTNHLYTVDQEAATADEKETDIRLRSTSSPQQGIIELKIGEKQRSAADLRQALKDQLLSKYLAPEHSRSGCLVVSVASNRLGNIQKPDRLWPWANSLRFSIWKRGRLKLKRAGPCGCWRRGSISGRAWSRNVELLRHAKPKAPRDASPTLDHDHFDANDMMPACRSWGEFLPGRFSATGHESGHSEGCGA